MFGDDHIEKILDVVRQSLEAYRPKIDKTYLERPGKLPLKFTFTLEPGPTDTALVIKSRFSFSRGTEKETFTDTVDPRQMMIGDRS